MSDQKIDVRVDGAIGWLMFNRPNVLNAFDPDLIEQTNVALAMLCKNEVVRAIIVHGSGRAFSAGFDIKASANAATRNAEQWRTVLEADFDFIMQFWNCPKPTISAVHGHCVGGAFELMLACDVTVAGAGALFGEPEVRFGSGIVAMLLPWFVGPKAAKEILLTGQDKLAATRAHELGFVNYVVADDAVLAKAEEVARDMAAAAPSSVRFTKQAINRSYEVMGMRQALLQALETNILIETSGGPERVEFDVIRREQGLKAALAWRDARFQKSAS